MASQYPLRSIRAERGSIWKGSRGGTVVDELLQKEGLIERYVEEGKNGEAVRHLFDLIVEHARRQDFFKAEALRAKIFEIDPLALREIVNSAEIINTARSRSIGYDRRYIWADLLHTLTDEEASALFLALEDKVYEPDQTLFERGARTNFLYFTNEGRLKLVFHRQGQEILLKTLTCGSIAGEDAYFSISLCTASLVTVTTARMSLLSHDWLLRWKAEFPVLESKILSYARKSGGVQDVLREKGLDRRTHKRIACSNTAAIQLLRTSGTPVGQVFRGSLADIARGGLSFLVRINRERTARLLLGQRLNVKFTHRTDCFHHEVEKTGLVVAVCPHAFEDYSVCVKFDEPLAAHILADIENYPERVSA